MKRFLSILLFSLSAICPLSAQNYEEIPLLLENKIWNVQLPKNKQYMMGIEFRNTGWRTTFVHDGKKTETFYSYSLYKDTITAFESQKRFRILELTDSTLIFQYLPDNMENKEIVFRCTTDNSAQGQWENENRLDSIWRIEDIWNKGFSITPEGVAEDSLNTEMPRRNTWSHHLEQYFISQMQYPENQLKRNVAGYSVVMFSVDTLGLPKNINILTTLHKEFDQEVIRLAKKLPRNLQYKDKNGKRIECSYTVYVPFLPQHYRNRIKN